jgi:hypothetical protein
MHIVKPSILLLLCLFFVVLCGCSNQSRLDLLKYKNNVLENRSQKNQFFKFSEDSPIPVTERWQFTELQYFPVDTDYQVQANYYPLPVKEELTIQTSSGQPRVYVKIGYFEFVLFDKKLKLMAYQEKSWLARSAEMPLFVPFSDETTGRSTYGAGRYLDVKIPQSDTAVLDFNYAYNPYCSYSSTYSCPIPPPENRLPVKIEAGEKNYTKI